MSKLSDFTRLKFILQKIEDLDEYQKRYGSIDKMLEDKLGFDGALMCLMQVGETLTKIEDENISEQLPVRGASQIRNFIAHDYMGVNIFAIMKVIAGDLPDLKAKIQVILSET